MDEKFQFKKKFGQNFLKNEKVLTRIVDVADIKDESLTIEVGPGSGALTKYLKEKGQVLCYEIDKTLEDLIIKNDAGNTIIFDFKSDVNKLNRLLIEYGIKPNYMLRFPGGSNNTVSEKYGGKIIMDELVQVMSEEGYKYYDWNVTSGDASKQSLSKEEIVKNVINGCKNNNNAVILFHDLNPKLSTVEALPEVIEYLLSENYEFRTLSNNMDSCIHFK